MARRRGPVLLTNRDAEKAEIVQWYRDRLEECAPPADLAWNPITIGPTWQYSNGWVLPEFTMGWEQLSWSGLHLRNSKARAPWAYTMEQARFILWFHAIDEHGVRLFYSAVLQRLKGWGKDPLAAATALTAAFAPIEFDGFVRGVPVGREVESAWIQIAAVSQEQTKNTMKLMPGLIPRETREHYRMQVGKQSVWGVGDTRQIEAVTSNPAAIEGGRPTGTIRNETQNWTSSNGGFDMAGAMEGNAAKAERGSSTWTLDICNAYRPGGGTDVQAGSVAQQVREGWERTQGDNPTQREFGLLYDSLEAPAKAPLTAEAAPSVVRAIRGDAVWLDADDRILKSIMNPANAPSESRRKWYNQINAAEDDWLSKAEVEAITDRDKVIVAREEVALFLDCSKSDDATALVAVRVSDGHGVVVGVWQRPPGVRGVGWTVPVVDVERTINDTFGTYRVIGFFADPSHVRDDETLERIWDPVLDRVHRMYRSQLRVWAKKGASGGASHSVIFDMSILSNQRQFIDHLKIVTADIQAEAVTIDPDARLRSHLLNSKRIPTRAGVSIGKEHRESRKKIDLAVAWVGAHMVRRLYLNTRKRGGWAA